MAFTEEQMQRYSRHLILKGVGVKGQQKLLESKVLVIGAGGLGSPAILYLAASGVGTICIVDGDCVDLTNLQRQIIHDMDSLGVEKTESAGERIRKLNPDVKLHLHAERVTPENIMALIEPYDFIIDAVDNFSAKFLISLLIFYVLYNSSPQMAALYSPSAPLRQPTLPVPSIATSYRPHQNFRTLLTNVSPGATIPASYRLF